MENEHKSQSPTEGALPAPDSPEWNARPELQETPKNPAETPTAELVADYEKTLGQITQWEKERHEYVEQFDKLIKDASVESARLRSLISKRLGLVVNSPFAEDHAMDRKRPSVSQQRRLTAQRAEVKPTPTPTANKQTTIWCDPCGVAIAKKGWGTHQAAHQRHGATLPRTVRPLAGLPAQKRNGRVKVERTALQMAEQEATRPWVQVFLKPLKKHGPILSTELARMIGVQHPEKRGSVAMSILKKAGFAMNDGNHLWTITTKGEQLLAG